MNIAINGFGRIGRNFLRALLKDSQASKKITVAAINIGPGDIKLAAHLFKYDTLLGPFQGMVELEESTLVINGKRIALLAQIDPVKIDWRNYNIDWVVECTGKFTKREGAQLHLAAGAKQVLISAPAHGEDVTIIPGVNSNAFDSKKHQIVSLGSCTTNAFLPTLKVLNDAFTLTQGFMTTVHAYTNSQPLLDVERSDPRRARAAALNIIPTSTGAGKLVGKILPELEGKIGACALRVPVGKVSLIDLSFTATKPITAQTINDAFTKAAQSNLKSILTITQEPLVSSDFSGNDHSVIIDGLLTQTQGSMGTVFGWYDNEWGYSVRLKDFLMSC